MDWRIVAWEMAMTSRALTDEMTMNALIAAQNYWIEHRQPNQSMSILLEGCVKAALATLFPPSPQAAEGLLPCPFCGGSAVHYTKGDRSHFSDHIEDALIECGNGECCAMVYGDTDQQTIIAWNRRASPQTAERRQTLVVPEMALVAVPGEYFDGSQWLRDR